MFLLKSKIISRFLIKYWYTNAKYETHYLKFQQFVIPNCSIIFYEYKFTL